VGYKLLESTLLLAADVKYALYSDSSETLDITTEGEGGGTVSQALGWQNVFGFNVGAEYLITPHVPVRLGYEFTQSATPKERPLLFATPPGVLHGIHAGAGVRLENWDFDIGGIYAFGSADVSADETEDPIRSPAGRYEIVTRAIAISATYHR
jgi:long-subunit fatty acid transport protein